MTRRPPGGAPGFPGAVAAARAAAPATVAAVLVVVALLGVAFARGEAAEAGVRLRSLVVMIVPRKADLAVLTLAQLENTGREPAPVSFPLPRGAARVKVEAGLEPRSDRPDPAVLTDARPLEPGEVRRSSFSFEVQVAAGRPVVLGAAYPADRWVVLVQADAPLRVTGLADRGVVTVEGTAFRQYEGFSLPAGFQVAVEAGRPVRPEPGPGIRRLPGWLPLAAAGLVAAAAVAWTASRRAAGARLAASAGRPAEAGSGSEAAAVDPAEVTARLAELDAAYADEPENPGYRRLRQRLSALLEPRPGGGPERGA